MSQQKNKQTIAIDLDDVLALNAQEFVNFSNRTWGTNLTIDDFQEDFHKMWGISNDEINKRMHRYIAEEIAADYAHFEEAVPVLKKLSQRYDLVVVTSRRKKLLELTAKWVERYFPGIFKDVHHSGFFDDLHDGSYHMTKAQICQDIGADYLIDDQLKHCIAVAEAGIQALLFGEYSWNRATELPERVTRVHNWKDVERSFDGQN